MKTSYILKATDKIKKIIKNEMGRHVLIVENLEVGKRGYETVYSVVTTSNTPTYRDTYKTLRGALNKAVRMGFDIEVTNEGEQLYLLWEKFFFHRI